MFVIFVPSIVSVQVCSIVFVELGVMLWTRGLPVGLFLEVFVSFFRLLENKVGPERLFSKLY